MKSTIALIGSQAFCERMRTITLPAAVQLEYYEYDSPGEAAALAGSITACDAVLFSGSLPYEAAKNVLPELPIPAFVIEQTEQTLALTLLSITSRKNVSISDLSIDVKNLAAMRAVLRDIRQEKSNEPAIFHLSADSSMQDVVSFHQQALKEGRAKLAVTSVHAVYDELRAAGLPCTRIIDPESSLQSAVERAAGQALLKRSQSAKNAAALLQSSRPFDESTIRTIAASLQAEWTETENRCIFYTTYGNIESALSLAVFQQLLKTLHPEMSIAFGTGFSAVEANENAESALHLAAASAEQTVYLLDEQKQLRRLLQNAAPSIRMKIDDPKLLAISKKAALSPTAVSKLLQFNQLRQGKPFTANDLAGYLQVSRRTAERTIKKLLDEQLIAIAGEEMTYAQGRPRALYILNFRV